MKAVNRLGRIVGTLNRFPDWARKKLLSKFFGLAIPFAGTSRIEILNLNYKTSTLAMTNKRRTRNHIGSIHAAAMALLAESATGFIVGMNVADNKLVLLKKMNIDYTRRCEGNITAVAELTDEQVNAIRTTPKGDVTVQVTVSDATDNQPIHCEMVWAWTEKKRQA